MDTIGGRILYLLKKRRITKTELAGEIGRQLNTVSRWTTETLERRTIPSDLDIEALASFLDANPTWIATGKGEPFVSVTEAPRHVYGDVIEVNVNEGVAEVGVVVEKAFSFMLGALPGVYSDDTRHVCAYVSNSRCMSPKIEPGDTTILEITDEIQGGAVYLIHHPDCGTMLTIAYPKADEILLDCPGAPDSTRGFVVSREGLTVIGRAVRVMKTV